MPSQVPRAKSNSPALRAALRSLAAVTAARIGLFRMGAALGLLGLAALHPAFGGALPAAVLYAALTAAALLALRGGSFRGPVAAAAPFLDVALIFLVQHAALAGSSAPAGVAGLTLGPLLVAVLFASLTLRPGLLYATALAAACAEALLQREAGVGYGAIGASAIVLGLATVVSWWSARQIEAAFSQSLAEQLAARRLRERSVELERANGVALAARAEVQASHEHLLAARHEAEVLSSLLVHDLKGPLTALMLLVDRSRRDLPLSPAHAPLAAHLAKANDEGRRLLAMIHDLLAIARLEGGALAQQPAEAEPAGLVRALVELRAAEASRRGIALSAGVLEAGALPLDRDLVQRALEKLVDCALASAGHGGSVQVSARRAPGGWSLAVSATGAPLSSEARARLFERSPVADEPSLYFCRLVARAHGGEALVEDAPGWPSTLVLRLHDRRPAAAAA